MRPINSNSVPCNPQSSNCVIWQGNDIPCINLCKGDTITTVVEKLATELCSLMDMFNITNYDLECLSINKCQPENFSEFIQILIDKVCKVNNIESPARLSNECPSCLITLPECLRYTNNVGDIVTSLPLEDFVKYLANKICYIIGQINTIFYSINDINNRITILENKPEPTLELPKITPSCVLNSVPKNIDEVLQALEQQFCQLRTATGTATNIYLEISRQCAGLDYANRLSGSGTMMTIPGWHISPVLNLAQSVGNMWLTICDMRNAIQNILQNCCSNDCNSIEIRLTAVMTGESKVTLYFTGTIPSGYMECNFAGTPVTISDESGNVINIFIPLIALMNNPTGYTVNLASTPINIQNDLTITVTPCLFNSNLNITCQSVIQYTIDNDLTCPNVVLTPGLEVIDYSITTIYATGSMTVKLYNSTNTVLIATNTITITSPNTYTGQFTGLSMNTAYNVQVTITVGSETKTCNFVSTTTLPESCANPGNITGTIIG